MRAHVLLAVVCACYKVAEILKIAQCYLKIK